MTENARITQWLNPIQKSNTKYGFVTNQEWLNNECNRIRAKGFECDIFMNSVSLSAALFYTKGYYLDGKWVNI